MKQEIQYLWPENGTFVSDQSNPKYSVGNEIVYSTEVVKSDLNHFNDPYILVRGNITIIAATITQVSFKNRAAFTKCFTKIDGTVIDDAEGLDLVMPMYNFLEYSSNYSITVGSLCFFSQRWNN